MLLRVKDLQAGADSSCCIVFLHRHRPFGCCRCLYSCASLLLLLALRGRRLRCLLLLLPLGLLLLRRLVCFLLRLLLLWVLCWLLLSLLLQSLLLPLLPCWLLLLLRLLLCSSCSLLLCWRPFTLCACSLCLCLLLWWLLLCHGLCMAKQGRMSTTNPGSANASCHNCFGPQHRRLCEACVSCPALLCQ